MKCTNLFIKTIQIHKYSNSQNILKPNDINSSKLQKSAPETSSLQEVQRQKKGTFSLFTDFVFRFLTDLTPMFHF